MKPANDLLSRGEELKRSDGDRGIRWKVGAEPAAITELLNWLTIPPRFP